MPDCPPASRIAHQSSLQMSVGFDVNRNHICACFNKFHGITARLDDHQMRVNRHLRLFSDRFQNRQTNRNIRHKPPVHHIKMQNGRAALFDGANFFASRVKSADKIEGAISNILDDFLNCLSLLQKRIYPVAFYQGNGVFRGRVINAARRFCRFRLVVFRRFLGVGIFLRVRILFRVGRICRSIFVAFYRSVLVALSLESERFI